MVHVADMKKARQKVAGGLQLSNVFAFWVASTLPSSTIYTFRIFYDLVELIACPHSPIQVRLRTVGHCATAPTIYDPASQPLCRYPDLPSSFLVGGNVFLTVVTY